MHSTDPAAVYDAAAVESLGFFMGLFGMWVFFDVMVAAYLYFSVEPNYEYHTMIQPEGRVMLATLFMIPVLIPHRFGFGTVMGAVRDDDDGRVLDASSMTMWLFIYSCISLGLFVVSALFHPALCAKYMSPGVQKQVAGGLKVVSDAKLGVQGRLGGSRFGAGFGRSGRIPSSGRLDAGEE